MVFRILDKIGSANMQKISSFLGIDKWTNAPYPFYLASPCYGETLKLEVSDCDCRKMEFPVYDEFGKRIGNSYWCDTFKLFGERPVSKEKCLKVRIDPDYSKSFCYNNDLSNQIYYPSGMWNTVYGSLFGMDFNSVRGECIERVDDYSIVFNPECMNGMQTGFKLNLQEGKLGVIKEAIKKLFSRYPTSSSFNSIWPVDVFMVEK